MGGYQQAKAQIATSYPLSDEVYTTLQKVWGPIFPSDDVARRIEQKLVSVYDHNNFKALGLGARFEPGLPWIEHKELAPDFTLGNARRSLAYIWLAADPQVIDEESPIRMENFPDVYRPHGHLSNQVFEAHTRTAQRISELSTRPFDFSILPGDLTDTGQKNEVRWLLAALNGGVIDPDSGIDNDPVPGPGNDYNDPFIAKGISFPWYPALGNHDTLYMGGFGVINDEVRAAAVGDTLYQAPIFEWFGWNGFLAGDSQTAALVETLESTTPADSDRLPVTVKETLQTFLQASGSPVGHGYTQDDVDNERGYYVANPIADKPIKLIVLNTSNPDETTPWIAFEGSMDEKQFAWFEEQLNIARDKKELVIVVSHHRLENFHNSNGIESDEVQQLMTSYNNIVAHFTGHGHRNSTRLVDLDGEPKYWELMTASTVDFPLQSRIVELVDEQNGFVSMYVTNLDHNSTEGSLAGRARHISAAKRVFGTRVSGPFNEFWAEDKLAQNLLLRIKIPPEVEAHLSQYAWSEVIESEETLNKF